jgi:HlyD family secretion protein
MITARRNITVGVVLGALSIAAALAAAPKPTGAQQAAASGTAGQKGKNWQAVAPGLVEPKGGTIKISAPVLGRISDIAVKANDKVVAGDPLIRLDDEEAQARVASAQAQAAMRERARNESTSSKSEKRRDAEDAVANAEASVLEARKTFDRAVFAKRAGSGSDAAIATARTAWANALDNVNRKRADLSRLVAESGTPLPTQNEGQLNAARADLRLAVAELERLTIRAPVPSTVLQVNAKVGEMAAPSAPQPLLLLGDLTALRVRAELDEYDTGKVKPGDKVVVRSDAVNGREFAGKVTAIAPMVEPGRINSTSSRNLSDFHIAEVLIDLDDPGPLLTGMKVDVYFLPNGAVSE